MSKLPYFTFYPTDWLGDTNLKRCSSAAKGVWIDLLCLMHQCDQRGVLATYDKAWTDEDAARAVGGDLNCALAAIQELLDKGVVSRTKSGALSSRRMVRDEARSQVNKENGKLGGNPSLKRADKRPVNGGVNRPSNRPSNPPIPSPSPIPSPTGGDSSRSLRSGDPISESVPAPEPAKPKRKAPETGALAVYLTAWAERYGEEPHPIGGEVAAANKALHPFTPEDRERIVRAFVADDDGWLVEHAHPIGAITRHLDRIRAKLNGKLGTGRRPTPPLVGANHPTLTAEEQSAVDEARRQEDESRRARFGVAS